MDDPRFLELQKEIAENYKRGEILWKKLLEEFPTLPDFQWVLMGDYKIHLRHKYITDPD